MNDAVDRLIVERQGMDHGFGGGMLLSAFAHLMMIGAAAAAPYLKPKEPLIKVTDVFAVPMPPGGGGPSNPEPPAPAAAPETPEAEPAPPKAAPPPTLIKPPTKNEPKTKGLPVPDAKVVKKTPKKDEPAKQTEGPNPPSNKAKPTTGAPGGKGTNATTPGLDIGGPQGPGVPTGTDWLGDWYMAGVQRKIWSIWNQQLKTDFNQPVAVRFTIVQDGTVTDVQVAQSSGATLLDLAAQRAVYSAQPFGPIPKNYGMDRITIQATFKPIAQ